MALSLAATLAACAPAANTVEKPSASATTEASALVVLAARPLRLPSLGPGESCPASPVAKVSVGISEPRGHGPFYLGGPMPTGGFPWNKMVYAVTGSSVAGTILWRGGRIDGVGQLKFTGQPLTAGDTPLHLTSAGGQSGYFYAWVIQSGGDGGLYVYPSSSGCYAIQIDGPQFEDVIVLSAN